jgi:hypothetical protein
MSTSPYWVTWNPLQGALNAVDELFFGVPSNAEQAKINAETQSDINQAANGNTVLASNEYQQYLNETSGAFSPNLEGTLTGAADSFTAALAKFEKYLPWIAGGLIALYLLPIVSRVTR